MAGLPMSQYGPNRSQMVPNGHYNMFLTIWDHVGPIGYINKLAMFGHFWSQKGHNGPPRAHHRRMTMAETASKTTLYVYEYACATDSQSKHKTKTVVEKAQSGKILAKNAP